eukprot:CAMPEP_0174277446 /NCGR_PEP_ID=MMETSP0439-20130205/60936_1 /TAXON_ID=0 /ORGANISM="Stereomyxa ramosa, Strain Chinc5" /LENGTH=346 /DNA_ID=CAMNT_0015369767 /DNA_START=1058 /DNA_END=2098 /DNA_ORIENTATION=-
MNDRSFEKVIDYQSLSKIQHHYSMRPKYCILHSQASDVMLDFVKSVHVGHKEENVFSFQYLEDLHQAAKNYGFTVDVYLSQYLYQMLVQSPNSVIAILSDHGTQWASTLELESERRLPFFGLILPKNLPKVNFNDVWNNQFTITTHFDFHKTMLELIDAKEQPITNTYYYRPWPILPKMAQDSLISGEIQPRSRQVLELYEQHPCSPPFVPIQDLDAFQQSYIGRSIIRRFEKYVNKEIEVKKTSCLKLKVERMINGAVEEGYDDTNIYEIHFNVTTVSPPHLYATLSASFSKDIRLLWDWKVSDYNHVTRYSIYSGCRDQRVDKRFCICRISSESPQQATTNTSL